MNKAIIQNFLAYVTILVIVLVFFFAGLIPAYIEARTFNKFSKTKKATVVDAMFAELRVEACN